MNYKLLYQWGEELASRIPSLNAWQIENVALFSLGVIRAESCQQEEVARQVSCGEQVSSTSRRWRRFLANERFPLQRFFGEWVRWVVGCCDSETLYLLVDETKLQDRLGVMVVGLAWEGRCIPLVWRCYKANSAADYPAEGQVDMIEQLLKSIQAVLPPHKKVIVLADRGIGTSPSLCRKVAALGWEYLFRVTKQCKVCTEQGEYTIAETVQTGEVWAAEGRIFKKRGRIPAHARAIWQAGYAEPWALVTNDPTLSGHEYALRNWQEQAFRDLKSGGWHWGSSRVRHPNHMERLLVILVVAYAWVLALGAYAVYLGFAHPLSRRPDGSRRRHWSMFKEGLQCFTQYVQRKTVCLRLCFVSDKRFP